MYYAFIRICNKEFLIFQPQLNDKYLRKYCEHYTLYITVHNFTCILKSKYVKSMKYWHVDAYQQNNKPW